MNNTNGIKVWDLAVRIFHWSLVLFFTISYLTGEDESDLHAYAGYVVLGLVIFRIFWGFIGTRHARFTDFVFGPNITLQYAKSLLSSTPRHYLGHNPLGGWMVIALLVSIFGICWSGLELYATEGKGPLASNINIISIAEANDRDVDENEEHGEEGEEFWEEVHELFANFTLSLIALHITGVIIGTVIHKEKLVKAMITGYKNGQS